jgi:hypothetical protein
MWSLSYSSLCAISCKGESGGLMLFWNQLFSIYLHGISSHVIDVTITMVSWRATFV